MCMAFSNVCTAKLKESLSRHCISDKKNWGWLIDGYGI